MKLQMKNSKGNTDALGSINMSENFKEMHGYWRE